MLIEKENEPGTALAPRAQVRPEILAPAGTEEMMRAAVENGADAVYFGLQQFNARLRANNFAADDLPRIMAWLHERGVKGYVTLNTLVFSEEVETAAEALLACSNAGVDAVLVQDIGIAELANRLVPDLPIHASTQMTVTSAESVHGIEALGIQLERVVAARELSRRELKRMGADTDAEIEVFVHGAICVAYSGQCLTSEALGGRSANRGECAQACRLPYDLIVDGAQKDLGDLRYLLSPKDLSAFEDIGDLTNIGIVSLKIEGRLKSPQYVAATVKAYRKAVDEAFAGTAPKLDEESRRMLEMTFSRGLTGGYIHETNHQAVVEGRFPKKRGLYLGTVKHVQRNGVVARIEGPLKLGDGVVFDGGKVDEDEEGGRLFEMFRTGTSIKSFDPLKDDVPSIEAVLRFGGGKINFRKVNEGDRIWKTSDPTMDAELAASYAEGRIHHHRPVRAHVAGAIGKPLELTLTDEFGRTATVQDTHPAEAALKRPLTREVLAEQVGRMGNTPFILEHLDATLHGDVMVPLSRLNELRRRAVEELIAKRRTPPARRAHTTALVEMRSATFEQTEAPTTPRLSVLCRSLEQVRASVAHGGIHTIYTDFEDIRLHKEARELIPRDGPRFAPATLRIVKPGEAGFVRVLLQSQPDALLVRNLSSWHILRAEDPGIEVIADYSMNIANDLTARLLHRHGFHVLTPSYDLNITQLLEMMKRAPASWFEVTLHQYMPMFHMEHCVFCRFLSDGTDFTNCGRPCESHGIALRDRVGQEHPVKADAGCRNTVFNAIPQSASEYLDQMLAAGVRQFRADFLTDDAAQVNAVIDAYSSVLAGRRSGHDLWRSLRATSKLGVTRGSLDHE
ncbi:U32 family peptidase [Candidatus Sumerlaeota bacterium]|nr:U32 family peptidase [Candidatus Sumerlaeota bacterium]